MDAPPPGGGGRSARTLPWWLGLVAAAAAGGFLLQPTHLPGGWLIGPLVVAVVAGLLRPIHPRVPPAFLTIAQAAIGVIIGAVFRPSILPVIAASWLPVVVVIAVTLGMGIGAGILLARLSPLSRETATLGTLPGGATAMIAMSIESGADTRMVSLMQYLRLLFVAIAAALVARFVPGGEAVSQGGIFGGPLGGATTAGWLPYLMTPIIAAAGVLLGRLARLPAAGLLGPLILGAAASGLGLFRPVWPPGVLQAAYITIGLYVGLIFDRASLRQAGRLMPLLVANVLVLIGVCAGTGVILAGLTKTDALSGYLATTPGVMDSIAAVALGSGADISLVLTVQIVRLFAIVFAGPVIARWRLGRVKAGGEPR